MAAGFFTLRVPSIESTLSLSELFAFACVLQFGPEAGAITLALDGVILSIRQRFTAAQGIFNFAMLIVSVWCSGVVFFILSGTRPLYVGEPVNASIIVPLGAMALTYFGINSGLTATVIGLAARRQISEVWREHFLPLLPSYFAAASVALLLAVALRVVHFGAIALILPLLLMSYLTFRSSFGRLEDSKQHGLGSDPRARRRRSPGARRDAPRSAASLRRCRPPVRSVRGSSGRDRFQIGRASCRERV